MSIFKDQQRDPRSWFDWLLLGVILRKPCPSYLARYKGKKRVCVHKRGHTGHHTDGEIKWGYGDNYFEGGGL